MCEEEQQQELNPIEALLFLYRKVMENPSFDQYQKYEGTTTQLFEQVMHKELTSTDKVLLLEVRDLHEQIIHVILEEQSNLNEEFDLFKRKKRASDHYGKLLSNYDAGAFFVDHKK